MAKINTMKTIELWKRENAINPNYDLRLHSIEEIYKSSKNVVEMIISAFIFGYAQGTKAEKKKG